MELKSYKGKRLLAIDYGLKRVGLAVSDELHITVRPIEYLENNENIIDKIFDIIKKENVGLIILGYPYRLDNQKSDLMKEIEDLRKVLITKTKLNVEFYDESYSSIDASTIMISNNYSKKKRAEKGRLDSVAAAIILKDFIENN